MFNNLFDNKIDAFIIESPVNRFYFTGFSASFGYVVLTENTRSFYTDPRYYEEARAALPDFNVKTISSADAFKVIAGDLSKAGVNSLGYEDGYLTVAAFKPFKKDFEAFTLKPATDILKSLRLIKRPDEIAFITEAQRIAEKAFDKITGNLRPGITEKELRTQLVIECLKQGAEEMAFSTIVAFGENSAIPHHEPSDRELKKTDLILIDFGVKVHGFCSDMTRTFCLTEPEEQIAQMYDLVLSAQNYVLKHLKAGMMCKEADSLAREYIRANGYDSEFSHSLGHGVGLEIHESPRLRENSQDLLLPGMVVTVEPGIYVNGKGGIRIEDMVVIREDGAENLTLTEKKLVL